MAAPVMESPGPQWLDRRVLSAVHERLIMEHGGAPGLRDARVLRAALARPRQLLDYRPGSSLFELAAAYAHAIARTEPFLSANASTAFMAATVFLSRNGEMPRPAEAEVLAKVRDLAAGDLGEDALARWLADNHATPDPPRGRG